jgi:hypothetical protein
MQPPCAYCKTPVHAAEVSHVECLVRVHAAGANLNNSLDEQGYTAAHIAAAKGDLDMLRALAAAGANLDRPGSVTGHTPVLLAVGNNRVKAVRFLHARGVDLSATTGRYTPAQFAVLTGARDGLRMLHKLGANLDGVAATLSDCSLGSSDECARYLLEETDAGFERGIPSSRLGDYDVRWNVCLDVCRQARGRKDVLTRALRFCIACFCDALTGGNEPDAAQDAQAVLRSLQEAPAGDIDGNLQAEVRRVSAGLARLFQRFAEQRPQCEYN